MTVYSPHFMPQAEMMFSSTSHLQITPHCSSLSLFPSSCIKSCLLTVGSKISDPLPLPFYSLLLQRTTPPGPLRNATFSLSILFFQPGDKL